MKKVLVIAPYAYLPFSSGGQKYIAKFLEYLGRETSLTVIGTPTNDWSLARNYRGLSLLKPSFSRYYDTRLVKKITALVREEGHDTLVCEHPYMAWLAFRVRKRTAIKVIIQAHNIEYQRFRSMGKWWWPVLKNYERRSFKKSDAVFFITREDRQFATAHWKIDPAKCHDVPFGIELNDFPADRDESKKMICQRHGIPQEAILFSFNGVLSYKPNLDALKIILSRINPLLTKQEGLKYKILISGRDLPASLNELKEYADQHILFTGFAPDIENYLKATAIFLNPVLSGGGIKTKIVEAIGYGATVVSTETGAAGLNKKVCGQKLVTTKDHDWNTFADNLVKEAGIIQTTPPAFYQYYQWENIIGSLLSIPFN